MQIDELYSIYLQHPQIETDTRKFPGIVFFALNGPNFNGNRFVQQALEKGASYCIADENTGIKDERIILVDNALETLQLLAKNTGKVFPYRLLPLPVPMVKPPAKNWFPQCCLLPIAVIQHKVTSITILAYHLPY